MGEEICGDCRSREEDIYWTHFQSIHFSQFLHAGFDKQLAIPENFTRNLKRKLPDIVTLKGPGGASWNVGLTANNGTFFFSHGWQEFVKDHVLEENDFLIFKYNGASNFDVLMFDKQSMCEKAASYFVRKCGQTELVDDGCQAKRNISKTSVEVITVSPHDDVGGSRPERSTSNDILDAIPIVRPIISQVTNNKTTRKFKLVKPVCATKSIRDEEPAAYAEDIEAKPDVENMSFSPRAALRVCYASRGRPATKEEKMNALLLAQAAVTDNGFLAVMKPTHVSRKFYMSVPSVWMNKHLPSLENQDVLLRFKEKTWHGKLYYYKPRNSGGISAGWKTFSMDNNLHEFDVCVFEPGAKVNNTVVLDISIFRAVQEVSPVDNR